MGFARKLLQRAVDKMDQLGTVTEEQLAAMTPQQRQQHEYWTARADAARTGQPFDGGDHRLLGRALQGPAGEALHGVTRAATPGPPIEDPETWAAVQAQERTQREAQRAPYLAAQRAPITITRVATRGGTQGHEIVEYLAASGLAARPDLVYGAARVPDRLAALRGSEKRRVVEWDVVHAATQALPSAAPPGEALLEAQETWVTRTPGQPSVLDEDLGVAILSAAGIGPEQTLGIARHAVIDISGGGEDSESTAFARITGVRLLVAAPCAAALAQAVRPSAAALPIGPPPGVHVEVLNWEAIAVAVQPVRLKRPPLPSPYPYLPLTAPELLRAYLEIVGVDPADSYGVGVTYDEPENLMSRTSSSLHVRKNFGGDEVPCADGEARQRLAGGRQIVLTYRDRPEYVEGRARWAAYCDTVLRADLTRELTLRTPVPKPSPKLLRAAERAIDIASFFSDDPQADLSEPRPRYCWPPR